VAKEDNNPGAVLIRALEPLEGIDIMKKKRGVDDIKSLTNGPGKLTRALSIDKRQNGFDLTGNVIFLEDADENFDIIKAKRIGISKGKSKLFRFYIKKNTFVSSGR
jgi:DNA-3-methyladenine glycosylase